MDAASSAIRPAETATLPAAPAPEEEGLDQNRDLPLRRVEFEGGSVFPEEELRALALDAHFVQLAFDQADL